MQDRDGAALMHAAALLSSSCRGVNCSATLHQTQGRCPRSRTGMGVLSSVKLRLD